MPEEESAYHQRYLDMMRAVAHELHRNTGRSDAVQWAESVSEELRAHFGSGRTHGTPGGAGREDADVFEDENENIVFAHGETVDIARNWRELSDTAGQERSVTLRALDAAVEELNLAPHDARRLRAVSEAIAAWQNVKSPATIPYELVEELQRSVHERLGRAPEPVDSPTSHVSRDGRGPLPAPATDSESRAKSESASGSAVPSEKPLGKRPDHSEAPQSTAYGTARHATDTGRHGDATGSASTSEAGASTSAAGVSTAAPAPQQAPSDQPKEDTKEPRNPWYTDYGMLGESTVQTVEPWTKEQAEKAAEGTASALPEKMKAMAGEIEAKIAEILVVSEPDTWADRLNTGVTHVVGDHLVWIRPVLTEIKPLQEPVVEGPVRRYQVRFNSTAAGSERSRTTSTAADAILFTAINVASAAASAAVVTMPYVAGEASQTQSRGQRQAVITGHKLFVDGSNRFTAGVKIRLFVDGVEHTSQEVTVLDGVERRRDTVARGLTVDFPSVYTRPDEPQPQVYTTVEGPLSQEPARPRPAGEVLNAIDLIPVIAHLQARLLAGGLSPRPRGVS